MAVFSRIKVWVSNEVLTASALNAEFNNILNNMQPSGIEDYSADVSTMQPTVDPGGVGTESLATTLAGEVQRLRYAIKRLFGGAQWYSTPTSTLAAGGIQKTALVALGQQISSSSSFSTSSTSYVDVTNLSVTITTTGRPVELRLVQDGLGVGGLSIASGTTISATATFKILRDSTDLCFHLFSFNGGTTGANTFTLQYPVSAINHLDVVAAGTYTYKVQMKMASASTTGTLNEAKLVAYEL